MASEDSDYSGLIKLLVFGLFALVGIVSSAVKKRREQQEIAERRQELRRLDDALGADRVRKGSSRKWSPPVAAPVPTAMAVAVPVPEIVEESVPDEPVAAPAALENRTSPARVAAAVGADYRKAFVWREILLPPLALREEVNA